MRKILYSIFLTSACFFASSCSDWFDINPNTDVTAEKLFSTEDGYYSALQGVYVSMTKSSSYGEDFTFGFIDQLTQIYDMVPNASSNPNDIYTYSSDNSYGSKGRIEELWKSSYNAIANTNNLIKWLDKQGASIVKDSENLKKLYGEAYALRAFLHFDILRAWGEMSYAYNPVEETKIMPYRTEANADRKPLLKTSEIISKVLTDLEKAKEYLSFEKKLDFKKVKAFGEDRTFRLNYHAVNAMLARVHSYNHNSEEAIKYAKEVIENCGLTLATGNEQDPALYSETIFGINLYKMDESIRSKFSEGGKFTLHLYTNIQKYEKIFGVSGTSVGDMRAKSTAFFRNQGEGKIITRKYTTNDKNVIPLIRLPEMYYILAEMVPVNEAAQYINFIRNKRGYSISNNVKVTNEEERINALNDEYIKEFFAEGQYFFFMKRHGISELKYTDGISLNKERYVFPLPDAEKEYGWTDEDEENKEGK